MINGQAIMGGAIVNREIGCTINTAPTQRRCDASNYIADNLEENADLRKIRDDKVNVVGNYGNGHHAKDIVDSGGLMATITTGNHNLGQTILIKNNNEKGFLEAESGDGINICGRMEYQRGNVQKGSCQTLSCRGGNDVGVVVENGQKIKETN